MKTPAFDYPTPQVGASRWLRALRLFVLGPLTGAAVAFAQTTAAMLCWVSWGEPDFYFRGWSGVQVDYLLLACPTARSCWHSSESAAVPSA